VTLTAGTLLRRHTCQTQRDAVLLALDNWLREACVGLGIHQEQPLLVVLQASQCSKASGRGMLNRPVRGQESAITHSLTCILVVELGSRQLLQNGTVVPFAVRGSNASLV
jgi:hypothetical protein